ncbi:MAG: PD-(D/E)XK motif protein [Candidatus Thorarchaeota archaeon]
MGQNISSIWDDLEAQASVAQQPVSRVYRALGETAVGIRAGFIPHDRVLELLIEIPSGWSSAAVLPQWRGMRFEILSFPLPPRQDAPHLRLCLDGHEHKQVFLAFCEDLVSALEGISDVERRVREIEGSIARWGRFFEKCGHRGLARAAQRGLFAELTWMRGMLDANIGPVDVVLSWKGCQRGYHDFDLHGDIVEVKSTMTKEPRSVQISNERQLDDRGLNSLHLLVVTLHGMEGGGDTLPETVWALRDSLAASPAALSRFERCLIGAGYLDGHAGFYSTHYMVRKRELFRVTEGFPRIIDVPQGVGHLRYSLTVSACQPHEVDLSAYLTKVKDL